MKALSRFKLIGRLINNRANIAAKQFADVKLELNQKKKKLDDLHIIAKEYREQLTNVNLQMSAEQFKQYHRFIDYLDFVIKQQADVVGMLNFEVEKKRLFWVQCRKQSKGLKDYIVNIEEQILVERLKNEQKELDSTVTDNYVYQNDPDV